MFQPLRVFTLLLCLASSLAAQTTQPAKPATPADDTQRTEAQARKQRGVDLLSETGFAAAQLEDQEFAARLLAQIAEALWKHVPETAEEFTRRAFAKALDHLQDEQPDSSMLASSKLAPYRDFFERHQLCQSIISLAERHNRALGKDLQEKFEGPWAQLSQEKRQLGYLVSFDETYLLSRKPGLGPQFPREFDSPFIGFTPSFPTRRAWLEAALQAYAASLPHNILHRLWAVADKDRAIADELFLYLLARIQADELAGPLQLLSLLAYPFADFHLLFTDGVPHENGWAYQSGGHYYNRLPPPPPLFHRPALQRDEWLVHRFLNTALVVLQRTAANQSATFPDSQSRWGAGLSLLSLLEPRVAALQPQRLAAFQTLKQVYLERTTSPQQAQISRVLNSTRSSQLWEMYARDWPDQKLSTEAEPFDTLKALISRAERAINPAERDYIYQEAALYAGQEGQHETALSLADKLSKLDYRLAVRAWLAFNAAQTALTKGQFAAVEKLAEAVTDIDQRTYLLCQLAARQTRPQRQRALQLLNGVAAQVRNAGTSAAQVRALWLLARSFAELDPARAQLELIELVRMLNKQSDLKWPDWPMTRTLNHPFGWPRITTETIKELAWPQPFFTLARDHFDDIHSQILTLEHEPFKLAALAGIAPLLFEQPTRTPEKPKANSDDK
jgi:hypothetical protein